MLPESDGDSSHSLTGRAFDTVLLTSSHSLTVRASEGAKNMQCGNCGQIMVSGSEDRVTVVKFYNATNRLCFMTAG
jgi:hypothetical protein